MRSFPQSFVLSRPGPRTDLWAVEWGVVVGGPAAGEVFVCECVVMKSSMRQWRRMVLAAMLAWVLLFLGLLSYFLDARVGEPLSSAGSLLSQHPDIRRLASIQGSQLQHAITGFRPELAVTVTASYHGSDPKPETATSSPTSESSMEVTLHPNSDPYGSQEVSQPDYLDRSPKSGCMVLVWH